MTIRKSFSYPWTYRSHPELTVVTVFEGESMDKFVACNRNKSVHEVNITDILALSHLSGHLPARRALIGIQPETIDWSSSLSSAVNDAIPKASELAHQLIMKWR